MIGMSEFVNNGVGSIAYNYLMSPIASKVSSMILPANQDIGNLVGKALILPLALGASNVVIYKGGMNYKEYLMTSIFAVGAQELYDRMSSGKPLW